MVISVACRELKLKLESFAPAGGPCTHCYCQLSKEGWAGVPSVITLLQLAKAKQQQVVL
jgi:hypothetical protein